MLFRSKRLAWTTSPGIETQRMEVTSGDTNDQESQKAFVSTKVMSEYPLPSLKLPATPTLPITCSLESKTSATTVLN